MGWVKWSGINGVELDEWGRVGLVRYIGISGVERDKWGRVG